MSKSLLYRLFGAGKIPAPLMSELNSEGIVLIDEGVKGSITYRNFRAPGKSFSWRRQGFAGSIVVTKTRIVGLAYTKFLINAPLDDERLRKMKFSVEANGALCVAFDAALFHSDWSGEIEYRFKTDEAKRVVELLQS